MVCCLSCIRACHQESGLFCFFDYITCVSQMGVVGAGIILVIVSLIQMNGIQTCCKFILLILPKLFAFVLGYPTDVPCMNQSI